MQDQNNDVAPQEDGFIIVDEELNHNKLVSGISEEYNDEVCVLKEEVESWKKRYAALEEEYIGLLRRYEEAQSCHEAPEDGSVKIVGASLGERDLGSKNGCLL